MKMALKGNTLILIEVDAAQFAIIKSWNKMRWIKKLQELQGTADLELLDRLAGLVRLPPDVDRRRSELRAVQDAVDRQRVADHPAPLFEYPVKMPLYAHQTRGANMALITFGWVPPENQTNDRSVRA